MRYLLALGAGGGVTLVLFFFMSVLIDQRKKKPVENDLGPVVEFIRVKRDNETKTRSRELPKKPPPPKRLLPSLSFKLRITIARSKMTSR